MGPMVGALISFITIPLTTYFVDPAEYGKASMFTLFQTLIIVFLFLGLDQAYTREYFEAENKINLLKNALLFPLTIAVILLILICSNLSLVSELLFSSGNYHLPAFLFGFTIIMMVIERFILLSIRMEEKAFEYSIVNIVIKISILLVTLIFVMFIRRDFLAVIYASVSGQILGDLYLIIRYRVHLNYIKFTFDKPLVTKLLMFGLPLIFSTSLGAILNSLDRVFLRAWSSFTEIGIFTAALKVAAILSIVQASFTSFWVPMAYRWHNEKKEIEHFQIVSNVLLLIMSILFMMIVILKDYVTLLLSPEYSSASLIIGMLCLQPIMYTVSETTTLGIVFSRKSYLNIYVSLISIIPNIVLNILLVPKYGSIGAAIAIGVSYIFFFISRSILSNRYWEGFPIKLHLFITVMMFIAALINTVNFKYITLINFSFLVIILLIQFGTIQRIYNMYFKKSNEKLDFS
ncbi:oligosaccharide flippase family protein [Priestia aryabhattai]|uniref:oligosaccharide flippase family protein n=1 Tax=Priestia aryabhattai TaxID=412384 RepID=UPI0030CC7BF5